MIPVYESCNAGNASFLDTSKIAALLLSDVRSALSHIERNSVKYSVCHISLGAPIVSDHMPPQTKPAQSSANRRSYSNTSGNRRRGSSRKHRRRKAPGPPPQTPPQTLTNLQAHVETQTTPAPISEWTWPGCTRSLATHYRRTPQDQG